MASVQLNEIPEAGHELEDYIAALFQASGYFVEKNLVQRDPTEILELDVVATDYTSTTPQSILAEVKGGKWGYPDAFKVVGWMRYLNLTRGAFCVKDTWDKNLAQVAERMAPLGLSVVHFDDFSAASATFSGAGLGTVGASEVIPLWRYSYSVERRLTDLLLTKKKSEPGKGAPAAALEYQRLVNDGIFFAPSELDQLDRLYAAYKEHPKLTLAAALEMEGHDFDPHIDPTRSEVLRDALREGKHPLLHACMYVEHRARLALLKAAVDYCCAYPDGPPSSAGGGPNFHEALFSLLPETFRNGVEWLRQQPTFHRYALLWQQFLWGWGGFYLDDREAEEFAWMATYSGVPAAEVPVALEAFDRFFPTPNGWFDSPGWTYARRLKLMPMYFHGLGTYHRRSQYKLTKGLSGLNCRGYTISDLATWNNAAVDFLSA